MTHLSDRPPANGFDDLEIPTEVAKLRVSLATSEEPVGTLIDTIYSARSIGVPLREIATLAGITENTLRKRHPEITSGSHRQITKNELALEILVIIAATESPLTSAEIANRLSVHHSDVFSNVVGDLWEAGLCRNFKDEKGDLMVPATPETFVELRSFLNRHYLRKPDSFLVVLDLCDLEIPELKTAIDKSLGRPWSTYIIGPETVTLAKDSNGEWLIPVAAPSVGTAIEIATNLWNNAAQNLDSVRQRPAKIRDVIPPGRSPEAQSAVLDAFFGMIQPSDEGEMAQVPAFRWIYRGGLTEKQLATRCLTAAARAVRRAAGNQNDPPKLVDAEVAFNEALISKSIPLPEPDEKAIQVPAVEAMMIAADRLGPFPGGQLGSFKGPDSEPEVVNEVEPTEGDLIEMAAAAGRAVSGALERKKISLRDAVRPVVANR